MIIGILVALVIVIVVYVGYLIVDAALLRKLRMRKRVSELVEEDRDQPSPPAASASEEEPLPTIAWLISARGIADKLFIELLRAGIKLRPSEFIAITAGLSLALALLSFLVSSRTITAVLAMLVGVAVPIIYMKALQAQRLAAFNRQLPDALSMISSAIRTGFAFPRGVQMVAEQMPAPIAEEFQRFINETSIGLAADAAFARMTSRVRSYDLELVVTAVLIHQQIGGNLAEILDNIAETIRERVRIEGELAALTADGRLSGIALVLLPLVLAAAIALTNPGYLSPLIVEPLGKLLVLGAVCMQVIGGFWIMRMLALDY